MGRYKGLRAKDILKQAAEKARRETKASDISTPDKNAPEGETVEQRNDRRRSERMAKENARIGKAVKARDEREKKSTPDRSAAARRDDIPLPKKKEESSRLTNIFNIVVSKLEETSRETKRKKAKAKGETYVVGGEHHPARIEREKILRDKAKETRRREQGESSKEGRTLTRKHLKRGVFDLPGGDKSVEHAATAGVTAPAGTSRTKAQGVDGPDYRPGRNVPYPKGRRPSAKTIKAKIELKKENK